MKKARLQDRVAADKRGPRPPADSRHSKYGGHARSAAIAMPNTRGLWHGGNLSLHHEKLQLSNPAGRDIEIASKSTGYSALPGGNARFLQVEISQTQTSFWQSDDLSIHSEYSTRSVKRGPIKAARIQSPSMVACQVCSQTRTCFSSPELDTPNTCGMVVT